MPAHRKTERNKLVIDLIDNKKWTYARVAKELGLKSRSSIRTLYVREKKKLSTI